MNCLRLATVSALFIILTLLPSFRAGAEPNPDTAVFERDGTAQITRVIPVPETVSKEAQALLATGETWAPWEGSELSKRLIEQAQKMYPVSEESNIINGIKVRLFTPPNVPATKQHRLLINLHGGGFMGDSGSFLESIPVASITRTPVLAVYYRLAKEAPFPAAVDDTIAVYKELLKTHRPDQLVIYGTSAGAILAAQVAVRLKHDSLPLPAALGFFSGIADFTKAGDSMAFFGVPGLAGARIRELPSQWLYMKGHDPRDPLASPIYADLSGLPPTLNLTGTRDMFLSGTVNFHQALLKAGVSSELVVFEAMPHAFWYRIDTPEAREALADMAAFFDRQLDARAEKQSCAASNPGSQKNQP